MADEFHCDIAPTDTLGIAECTGYVELVAETERISMVYYLTSEEARRMADALNRYADRTEGNTDD